MNQDEVKRNLLSLDQWLRMLLMAGYLVVIWVLSMVLLVIIVTQTLVVLITGELNLNLQRFGAISSAYLYQIVIYLVYGTDEKPFPFSPLPGAEEDDDDDDIPVVVDVEVVDTDPKSPGTSNQV
ncbi:MAG: hypothetical protein RLZZ227_2545 [Pseudomonadota bacterium]|jgi:hypothetical protein